VKISEKVLMTFLDYKEIASPASKENYSRIEEQNRSMASRLIRDAAPKMMKYIPWWAASRHDEE
jgi:hypothetical protein